MASNDTQTLKNRDGSVHEFTVPVFVRQPNPVPADVVNGNARAGLSDAARKYIADLNNSPIPLPTITLVDVVIDRLDVQYETHTSPTGESHSQAKGIADGHALVLEPV
jgi:hypothetical protein